MMYSANFVPRQLETKPHAPVVIQIGAGRLAMKTQAHRHADKPDLRLGLDTTRHRQSVQPSTLMPLGSDGFCQ